MKLSTKDVRLPIMQCDDNCGECCGIVLCTDAEFNRVVNYAKHNGIEPIKQGATCPFFQGGRCTVYAVRPFPCRFFGHCTGMTCPRGYNANVTPEMEQRLNDAYGAPTRFLHEAIPGYTINDVMSEVERAIHEPEPPSDHD